MAILDPTAPTIEADGTYSLEDFGIVAGGRYACSLGGSFGGGTASIYYADEAGNAIPFTDETGTPLAFATAGGAELAFPGRGGQIVLSGSTAPSIYVTIRPITEV